jgi:hypothetical protein
MKITIYGWSTTLNQSLAEFDRCIIRSIEPHVGGLPVAMASRY